MSTYPIVGAFYRPPAKALIDVLPLGTPLTLMAEPDNQYDQNAVAVYLYTNDLPDSCCDRLSELLIPYGFELDQIYQEECWHLGYIAKELAKKLRETNVVPIDVPVDGTFSLSSGGAPRVRLTDEVDTTNV